MYDLMMDDWFFTGFVLGLIGSILIGVTFFPAVGILIAFLIEMAISITCGFIAYGLSKLG